MPFYTLGFVGFASISFLLYWLCFSRSARLQNGFLLVVGLIFYSSFDWHCLGLMAFSVLWTYGMGFHADKRGGVILGVSVLVGLLAVFKYCNFFLDSARAMLCFISPACAGFGALDLILPLGISFYTFMAIGYLVDVRRGTIVAERDLIDFAATMCFFPQLVAGPIGRANELLPQYRQRRVFDECLATDGCRQILWGCFVKFVVADNLATIANELLGCNYLSRGMVVCGALAYTIQIYCDFSGYSNLAIGLGKLFGIRLRPNFAYPYFSASFGDFWRRWHMSLTTWFRDYVYFPLGGSRCGSVKTIRNVWIVFLLSGLWHGAAWTFVAWGALHAAFLTVERVARLKASVVGVWIGAAVAWLLFRAVSFGEFCHQISALAMPDAQAVLPHIPHDVALTAGIGCAMMFAVEFFCRKSEFGLQHIRFGRWLRWPLYLILALLVLLCNGAGQSFIYQRF